MFFCRSSDSWERRDFLRSMPGSIDSKTTTELRKGVSLFTVKVSSRKLYSEEKYEEKRRFYSYAFL